VTDSVLTPTQLNALARDLLEGSFALIRVEGELSGVARPASGHLYFTLKDRNAQVRCALFRPKSQWLKFRPADGDQVIVRGRVTLYEPRGDFQLVAEHIEPAGEGALRRAFEELKQRLDAEGLFDAARRRPLPRWIGRLGVLSSPGGAAIHDVLTVLRRRFPLIEVELLPVPVQGTGAAAQIAAMLGRADGSGRYDALLLTRGGGSLEDLMAFNDEALARAIAACVTPVVAAIGHEIDTSIAELVADQRAPTPSAAAETLTPDRIELLARLDSQQQRLQRLLATLLRTQAQRLDHLHLRLHQQAPGARLARGRERLTTLAQRLTRQQRHRLVLLASRHGALGQRLSHQAPARTLERLRTRQQRAGERLHATMQPRLRETSQRLDALLRALRLLGPMATLGRGYAILRDDHGRLVSQVGQTRPGMRLTATLADGALGLEVSASEPRPARP